MSEQSTSLRLADALEATDYYEDLHEEAAAELRRLHAVNGELLEALHNISLASQDSGSTRGGMGRDARAAIARAEGNV